MEAVKPKNNIHDFRSELNQIAWSRACSEREWATEYFDAAEHKWILNDKYKNSRTKVIGKAIGDCVAGKGAFKDKTPDQIITFKDTNPETYGPENWNAVILYNYVHEAINGEAFNEFFTFDASEQRYYYGGLDLTAYAKQVSDVLQDKLKRIKKYYKQYCGEECIKKLEDAVNDIQEYVDALELNEWLAVFRETEMNYRTSDCPSCSDLAPHLDGNFSEYGGSLSRSFYRVDKDNALNKRLSYDLELRYQDNNLYVFSLSIDKESFEFKNDKGDWRKNGAITALSDPSELESPEFSWIMDRLEGLVVPPSKELWNEWCQKAAA